MTKVPQTTWNRNLFGIVNQHGDPWTMDVFGSEGAAIAHLKDQGLANPTWKLGRHKIVPVSVTVRAIAAKR